jgi:glyoxylase-like metal-dependent hydrolase (beta-lactamase superfamily II)
VTVTRTSSDGPVSVVTVTASEAGWRANSHLIVLETSVVLVDAPLLARDADAVASEITATGKPLAAVIVTHAHPDHFATAARFDVPVRALPAVAAAIAAGGDRQIAASYSLTGITDDPPRVPSVAGTIEPGTELIDGADFEFTSVSDGEASTQLVIGLPASRILLIGDLVSAGVHPFLAGRTIPTWIDALESRRSTSPRTLLPGHGIPSGEIALDDTIEYLDRAGLELAAASSAADLDARLDAAYPGLGGRRMHPLQDWFLFQ